MCVMHATRMSRHGDTSVKKKLANGEALAEFHRLRMIETDDCVLWTCGKDTRGYGQLRYESRVRKVHQLALELVEPRPAGAETCHVAGIGCSRHCMNIRHLYWGTHAENMADTSIDGTSNRGRRAAGAKLTEDMVRDIRSRYAAGGVFMREIGEQFGVSYSTVSDIVRRRRWDWLD